MQLNLHQSRSGQLEIHQQSVGCGHRRRGFFSCNPQGIRFTRLGAFKIDGNGQLVTKDGHPVLQMAPDGTDPAQRVINIAGGDSLGITDTGELFQGETKVGQLSLIKVANKDSLAKTGNSLFTFKPNFKPEIEILHRPSLKQGFIEMSNVNVVQEMTDMIATKGCLSRHKGHSAYDSMNGQAC